MDSRNIKKITVIFFIAAMIIVNNFTSVFAEDSKVVYEDNSNKVVTLPGDDLFLNFKEIYPGEIIEQNIQINNKSKKVIDLYLKAEVADDEKFENKQLQDLSEELIGILSLKLTLKLENEEEKIIYSGPASGITSEQEDVIGTMTEPILLGEFKKNSKATIVAKLSVPESLGNKYQNSEAKVKWIFSCDVKENKDDIEDENIGSDSEIDKDKYPNKDNVVTGDNSSMLISVILIGVSTLIIMVLVIKKLRNKNK